jgi:Flp pilus assembly protein CpaB
VLFAGQQAVSIIVADAPVLAVDARGRGGIGESASPFTVTIGVTARQSQLVAAAVADGELSLARTTGAHSARGVAPESLDRVAVDEAGRS